MFGGRGYMGTLHFLLNFAMNLKLLKIKYIKYTHTDYEERKRQVTEQERIFPPLKTCARLVLYDQKSVSKRPMAQQHSKYLKIRFSKEEILTASK